MATAAANFERFELQVPLARPDAFDDSMRAAASDDASTEEQCVTFVATSGPRPPLLERMRTYAQQVLAALTWFYRAVNRR